jgi:cyclase
LVKTVRFGQPSYIGDPVNTVSIFTGLRADEIMVLDITATRDNREPDYELLTKMARHCTVPFGYGGGIRNVEQARRILALGYEKLVLNSVLAERSEFITKVAGMTGSQAVVASIDVRRDDKGVPHAFTHNGTRRVDMDLVDWARMLVARGAGEILLYSIDRDGTMSGYDLDLVRQVEQAVTVPVIACGGAATRADLAHVVKVAGAQAAGAGAIFVYQKSNRSVLVNYPELPLRRASLQ